MEARRVLGNGVRATPPEEVIDPGLLEDIPDIQTLPTAPLPSAELTRVMDAIHLAMADMVSNELHRVELTLVSSYAEMEQRLADAEVLLQEQREENAQLLRMRDKYDRAFQKLAELTREIDDRP